MSDKSRKQQIEDMLAETPDDPFLHYGLAMEHVSAGDDESAVRCFRKLFTVTADYVPAYMQAGRALDRLGRIDEAREVFRQGIVVARQKHDEHALGEMQEMLANLGD